MLIEYLRTPRTRYHGGLRLKQPVSFVGRVTDGRVVFMRDAFFQFRLNRAWGLFEMQIGRRAYIDCESGVSWQCQLFELRISWRRRTLHGIKIRLAPQ